MHTRPKLNLIYTILTAGLLAFFCVTAVAADTYVVDPDHTSIIFRIKHLDIAYVYGRFNVPSGSFVFDEALPAKSAIEMQVQTKKVDTAVDKRDNHIRSPDFLNAGEVPLASFKSTAIKQLSDGAYEVSGNLMLLGQSRSIVFKAQDTGSGKDPWGYYRRGFITTFTIKRSEFGIDFMLNDVADEVEITVSFEGIRQ